VTAFFFFFVCAPGAAFLRPFVISPRGGLLGPHPPPPPRPATSQRPQQGEYGIGQQWSEGRHAWAVTSWILRSLARGMLRAQTVFAVCDWLTDPAMAHDECGPTVGSKPRTEVTHQLKRRNRLSMHAHHNGAR
jgi:hypothetical protein